MTPLPKARHGLNTPALIRAALAGLPDVTLPTAADQRAVRQADRAAIDYVHTPEDAVTVKRTSLAYSADALTPVTFDDTPHPLDADPRMGEPTADDYRRQLADVNACLRITKDAARAHSLAGLPITRDEIDAHAVYVGKLKAAQWRLTKTLAELDGAADVTTGRLSRSIAGHG